MSNRKLKIGLIQHACSPSATSRQNLERACGLIREAAGLGAQIVVTQELFTTHYFPQFEDESRFDLAETVPGPTSEKLGDLAVELGIEIAASIFERRTAGLYHNTAIMIGPDGIILGTYRKMHIPDDPRFFEKYYFTPGDTGWQTQQTRHARTGLLVCWDQWFPEAARLTTLRGAEILLYPTAIGWYDREIESDRRQQKEAWKLIQRSHAIANGVFVAAINRVGTEGDLKFWGNSFVCDPGGEMIAEATETDEQVLIAECDLGRIEQIRRSWPFLRDRRIDAYDSLTNRMSDGDAT